MITFRNHDPQWEGREGKGMAPQVFEVIPTSSQRRNVAKHYEMSLCMTGFSLTKLELYFLNLDSCKRCFSDLRACIKDSSTCFKELFHHGML